MKKMHVFEVVPSIPEELNSLQEIAYNIWWAWNPEAGALFRRIDPELWEKVTHNPASFLSSLPSERYQEILKDDAIMASLNKIYTEMKDYLNKKSWFDEKNLKNESLIAYFSMEFGLTECLTIYSGGLGVLAGDHLKSSSDLGLPLVGVGIFYQQGYFRQYLNSEGWQQERYPIHDFSKMPASLVVDENGKAKSFKIKILDKDLHYQVWKVKVGRVSLFLMDANIEPNDPEDRMITYQLYGGDKHMRIKQELLLGIGGMRLLHGFGLNPSVVHINEGHAAFLIFERIHHLMKIKDLSFKAARELVFASSVFTTHTPVPAGNDRFLVSMLEPYLKPYAMDLGVKINDLLGMGAEGALDDDETNFCMTVLALRNSIYCNGVSKLHGEVARKMWDDVWPGIYENDIPIEHVTNGVHGTSWIAPDFATLFDRYLGPKWKNEPSNNAIWKRVEEIPNSELWKTHERRRERLVANARNKLKKALMSRQALSSEIKMADEVLDPETLTIGFARRFATYKRGTLIFSDIERIKKILTNKDRPVQILIAGKAHPHDDEGKKIIKQIAKLAKNEELRRHIVFIEDYDIDIARYLVQGVDVWLNTPRRPLEASGTSGMKVCFNGGLNLSILDGWWDEAYDGHNGWAIGNREIYNEKEYQDEFEANALYRVLEELVVPLFYDRSADNMPRKWVEKMKHSMLTNCSQFGTNRMVMEYFNKYYKNAHGYFYELAENKGENVKELVAWKDNMEKHWSEIFVKDFSIDTKVVSIVGDEMLFNAEISINGLKPEDLAVELYYGHLDSKGMLEKAEALPMELIDDSNTEEYKFKAQLTTKSSGKFGAMVRILPNHKFLKTKIIPNMVVWG
ncbi:MAG: alpha-glucan family phosphorylase [Pseudomonadota bacterium]